MRVLDGPPQVVEEPNGNTVAIVLRVDSADPDLRALQYTSETWKNTGDNWQVVSGGIALWTSPKYPDRIQESIKAIKENIDGLNRSLDPRNTGLKNAVREMTERRMNEVKAKRQAVVDLAEAIGADLVLSESEQHIREAISEAKLRKSPPLGVPSRIPE